MGNFWWLICRKQLPMKKNGRFGFAVKEKVINQFGKFLLSDTQPSSQLLNVNRYWGWSCCITDIWKNEVFNWYLVGQIFWKFIISEVTSCIIDAQMYIAFSEANNFWGSIFLLMPYFHSLIYPKKPSHI